MIRALHAVVAVASAVYSGWLAAQATAGGPSAAGLSAAAAMWAYVAVQAAAAAGSRR